MRTRALASVALSLAVAGAMAAPAMALADNPSPTPVAGTVVSVAAASATAPAEVVLATASGTDLTYALTATTVFSLALPGLGTAASLPLSALAAGQSVRVTPSGALTDGLATAAAVGADATARMGTVSAVATSGGLVTAFDLASGSTTTLYSDTAATQTVSGPALAPGQDALVYGLAAGAIHTAYVVYTANFPALSGTLATANGVVGLATPAGTVAFNETSGMAVDVGTHAANSAFLVNGAQASITYAIDANGGEAETVDLAASTVQGTIQQVTPANGAIELVVATASGNATVAVLSGTGLGGQSLSAFAPGASLSATGVLSGTSLTALSIELTAPAPVSTGQTAVVSGSVVSLGSGQAVLDTSGGTLVVNLAPSTAYSVGAYPAQSAALAPGESVTVTYLTVAAGSMPTAEAVKITADTLHGQVASMTGAGSFTLSVTGGGSLDVVLAPGAAVYGASGIAAGDTLTLVGVEAPGQPFSAYAVWVDSASQPVPPAPVGRWVRGRIASVNGPLLTVAQRNQGPSVTVVLTGQTRYSLGGRTADQSLLAAGEAVTIRTIVDPTVANQVDAVAVFLTPAAVVGTVARVAVSGSNTLLTVQGMRAPWGPLRQGRDGWNRHMPLIPGLGRRRGATFTVILTPSTLIGPGGAQPQVGQRIAAVGAWSTQGLMAEDAIVQPAPPPPPLHKDHGGNQRHHGRAGHKGNRGNKGHKESKSRRESKSHKGNDGHGNRRRHPGRGH